MLNNYIGGGQVFLHKVRMFLQVFNKSITVSVLVGCLIAVTFRLPALLQQDLQAAFSYRKAIIARGFYDVTHSLNNKSRPTYIEAKTSSGLRYQSIAPDKVMRMTAFYKAHNAVMDILSQMLFMALIITPAIFFLVFLLWWKFGKSIQSDHKVKGGTVLTALQVRATLKSLNGASDIKVGDMPLVKDTETRHFLICGATGSGKTNLIDTILPQVESRKEPAVVIDQTGEMISKYYDPTRGDVIFNPLDARSGYWDFWGDCFSDNAKSKINSNNNNNRNNARLEKFAKILFGFNRKNRVNSDPFWENSAEAVFTSCAQHLFDKGRLSIEELQYMLQDQSLSSLGKALKDTPAARYLNSLNQVTASSILSVLTTSTRSLNYLFEDKEAKRISLTQYLRGVKEGKQGWLFLATSPSQRELTLPLIACLAELVVSLLMENGIQIQHSSESEESKKLKLWFVIDELAALGKLPALSNIMAEGRKYGACIIAAMQSLNQLYTHYGQYEGSTIFGQFGTKFFFRNDEPQIAKMITDMCGTELINRQQKNTSFGANEFRDGVSYTEQEKYKQLVEYSDIASLNVGECYAILPEPKVRLSKLEVPRSTVKKKNEEYISRSLNDSYQPASQHRFKLNEENRENKGKQPASALDKEKIDKREVYGEAY